MRRIEPRIPRALSPPGPAGEEAHQVGAGSGDAGTRRRGGAIGCDRQIAVRPGAGNLFGVCAASSPFALRALRVRSNDFLDRQHARILVCREPATDFGRTGRCDGLIPHSTVRRSTDDTGEARSRRGHALDQSREHQRIRKPRHAGGVLMRLVPLSAVCGGEQCRIRRVRHRATRASRALAPGRWCGQA